MKILLTNDDGIHAPGLKALAKAVPEGLEFRVVAPANERSASSHSISLGQKLRVEESEVEGIRHYAVYGTPVDCVKFALNEILDFSPDLIVSGINQGSNTGVSVYYSGTISAAREGFINRVPAVAVSLASKTFSDFGVSIDITRNLIEAYKAGLLPLHVMLNVNVPALYPEEIKGIKITKQAASRFVEEFVSEKLDSGKKVYTLVGEIEVFDADGTSDEEAVADGFISITPLKIDLTDYGAIPTFERWLNHQRREDA